MDSLLQSMNRRSPVWLSLLTNLLVLINQASFLVRGQQQYTSFNYPTFTSTDKLLLDRDAQYMPDTSSVWLNPSWNGSGGGLNYNCGSLIYAESIQMRETPLTDSAVASFNTSFTFSMIGENSAGFAFMFVPNNHTTGGSGGQLCLVNKLKPADDANNKVLAVEFDTWQNPEFNDSSSNHVGVNIKSAKSMAFYNLCGEGLSDCSYLVTAQDFTAWIDYDSASQSLEVFLANGSTIQGVSKPANAIIQVPHLDLSNVVNDYMFVGFSGSGAMFREVKKIKSWSFRSSVLQGQGSPSPSKKLIVGRVVGLIVSGVVGGMVAIAIGFKLFKVFGRPLRFFLSHAGGEDQEGKNFPDWLYDEMRSSWKLKYFIKVFLDRRCLPKGKRFPEQIMLELQKTEVGVVLITEDFFTRKWPMTELVAFVDSHEKNPAMRILPLFYKMNAGEVGNYLRQGTWEEAWTRMSSNGNHPIPVEQCRNAVKKLCETYGIEYVAYNRGHDKEYIKLILKDVGKILWEEIWKR